MDIISYLSDSSIDYRESGDNTTRGWIEIHCPFDDCNDSDMHMGVNLKSLKYKCWICGKKGYITDLIKIFEKCNYAKATKLVEKYSDGYIYNGYEREVRTSDNLWLPPGILKQWPDSYLDYLESRNFDSDKIIKEYKLMPLNNIGVYRFRILVPVFLNRQMVNWQAADIVRNESRIPYLSCPPEKAVTEINHCLYDIDRISDKAIVVEGVTDVWRLGIGAIATFTKNFTQEQILLLKKKGVKSVFVLYDSDAQKNNKDLAFQLSSLINHVEYIKLDKGDPADLTDKEARELKKDLLGL